MDAWWLLLSYAFFLGVMAGLLGGLLSSLAGVGGGLIYVPIFYFLLPLEQSNMAVYVMISMSAVFFTSCFSSGAHWRLGHVKVHVPLLCSLVIGAAWGLWMTLSWPTWCILLVMAMLNLWLALDMAKQHQLHDVKLVSLWGLPIGLLSGSVGIGGGTMLVPLLRRSMALRFAVGTSVFCAASMALLAVVMNVLFDARWWDMLQPNWGLILSCLCGLIAVLPFSTRWAATWHQTYSEKRIRLMLQMFFFLLAMMLFVAATYRYFV